MGYSGHPGGRLLATSPSRRVPGGAAPVLDNVLLTLVADRLSGDVPLSGGQRFVPAAVRCRPGPARPGPQDRARSGM
ncbi:hypothetical protein KBX53_25420 [Micromonospora sp. M51]|uniref:hypothetical protein n=1 Tax=Micromonospora sp. M51 TaxID=2824889 RepID=UPI001B38AD57|nr:hypothetical protein [Micromonospora sp. M51]MBQ1014221.1 hypothetical protein [Micromonospora sp. M51]